MKKDFEIMPHTADIKIRVYGKTLNELFKNAVVGMFQAIGPRSPECIVKNERLVCPVLPITHAVEVHSGNYESLLVDFLSEALYLSDVNNQAFLDATIQELTDTYIKATLHGIAITGFEVVEIKAVTYHELSIKKNENYWQADVVFDI